MCAPEFYKNMVPTNARAYIRGMSGETSPIDETFFKPDELAVLRQAALSSQQRAAMPVRPPKPFADVFDNPNFDLNADDLAKIRRATAAHDARFPRSLFNDREQSGRSIQYEDYPDPWIDRPHPSTIFGWMKDPSTIAQTTVGRANLARDDAGNTIVNDHYNFNVPVDTKGAWGFLHRLGERFLPEGKGYPVRLNLGPIAQAYDDFLMTSNPSAGPTQLAGR